MSKIQIIPLGGVGEFGMNCMGIRHADDMILIDAGMGFPEETPFGVDFSIPDFDFLEEYRNELKALILTHGHEDHIGAIPYLLERFNLPVYGSRFTLALIERRLQEKNMLKTADLRLVWPNDIVEIGSFKIEFIHASHSLVDCFSLAIQTPAGTIIHSGDYKIDETPVIGKPYDLKTLKKYGDAGVLALLSDSTNATVSGKTPSERAVIPALREIFAQSEGRIIVSTFSSSIHRIQIIFQLAYEFGKKVCVLGRSMQTNVEIADRLGILRIPYETLVTINDSRNLSNDEIVYLATGSQGETRAALWQMATTNYKGLKIQEGDTVVLSARIIPGNEKAISRLIGHLYKRGANIIEEKRSLIHVSGHASQEDIRILVQAARPKYLIPIHGEYRMLFRQEEFVKDCLGFDPEKVILIENGDILQLEEGHARIVAHKELERNFVNEEGLNEVCYEVVKERQQLASNGVVTVVLVIDKDKGNLKIEPQVTIQGVAKLDNGNNAIEEIRKLISKAVENLSKEKILNKHILTDILNVEIKRFYQRETGSKPMVIPTIIEI
ncbi:MAG: ribonuclease J [Pyrinomonadaceae bacterium]|nr:ribonuclease J [Pyrinomonadaceae bacterium]MCX7640580.1 ribonuclease J [Pyrinomonadaceae bacterium]MDW8303839.1 ribonuclease J [Acidobacteriota bacterium]